MFGVLKRIEVWGDSVLKGIIYDAGRNKYKHLDMNKTFDKMAEMGLSVKNNSKFGMTAPKARSLMMDALNKGSETEAAIIEFGGNDCDYKWAEVAKEPDKEHIPNTPLDVFKDCIADMVKTLRKHGIRPILMNLPPIHSGKYFDWITRGLDADAILRWLGDKEIIYRHHESYSLAITDLAINLSCDLIDVRFPFLLRRDYYNYLCEDGIHPNKKGYEIINQSITEFALKNV